MLHYALSKISFIAFVSFFFTLFQKFKHLFYLPNTNTFHLQNIKFYLQSISIYVHVVISNKFESIIHFSCQLQNVIMFSFLYWINQGVRVKERKVSVSLRSSVPWASLYPLLTGLGYCAKGGARKNVDREIRRVYGEDKMWVSEEEEEETQNFLPEGMSHPHPSFLLLGTGLRRVCVELVLMKENPTSQSATQPASQPDRQPVSQLFMQLANLPASSSSQQTNYADDWSNNQPAFHPTKPTNI